MHSRFVFVVVVPLVLGAVGGSGCGSSNAVDGPTASKPPIAAASTAIPPDLAAALPLSPNGKPILYQTDASGLSIGLGVDPTLDGPVQRWGQCLSRVLDCYRANPDGAIGGCVDAIQCKDDTGGAGCCPPACISAFHAAVSSGKSSNDAADESFVAGTCVAGFSRGAP